MYNHKKPGVMNNFTISGYIVDIVNRDIFSGEITVNNKKIESIKKCKTNQEQYILPGLIDSHVHIESSMLVPSEFAKIAVRHGTVAVISDPHEIANVLGIPGIEFMIDNGNSVNFKFFFGAPSCVPATSLETSGSVLDANKIEQLLKRDNIFYLSEMMNFPGVINELPDVVQKLKIAQKYQKPIDGHAPGLTGQQLDKYIQAGVSTDHESLSVEEAKEKISKGMKIQIREGSAAKILHKFFTLINEYPDSIMFCTDDSHPNDLIAKHINYFIRYGLKKGIDIFLLLRAATLNPVNHYGLNVGLLQKSDPADFIVVNNLNDFQIMQTYINGKLVFDKGKTLIDPGNFESLNNLERGHISENEIKVYSSAKQMNVIRAYSQDLSTGRMVCTPKKDKNEILSDIENDILKIVVVSRYNNNNPVVGFIHGFSFKQGAIASSIAHDSHNIIAVGTNDLDIVNSINKVIELKGGIVACSGTELKYLQLDIAGLMSHENGEYVANKYTELDTLAKRFGSKLESPFMTLSFMSLLVIPELKIGDKGLFDVKKFDFIELDSI
jgi:adenine deaminase